MVNMRLILSLLFVCGTLMAQSGNIGYTQVRTTDRKGTGAQFQMYCAGSASSVGQTALYDANGNVCPGTGTGGGSTAIQSPLKFGRYQAPVMPLGLSSTAAVTVASTASATTLLGKNYFGSATLPAGFDLGRGVRIHAAGLYGTTGTPTLSITIILGGVTIATISPSILGSVSNDGWELDYQFIPTDMATVIGAGCFKDIGTAGALIGGCASGSTGSLNFGTAQTIDVKATWSASSSSNTITAEVIQIL